MPSNRRAKRPLDVHERALRLLAMRPRSMSEIEGRLRRAGFDGDEIAEEIRRLLAVGLIDDEDFARRVAEHELGVRGSGDRAVVSRLIAKGVDRSTIERVLAETAAVPEDERALDLARDRLRRLGGLSPEVAFGRLVPFLQRRGFAHGTARRAAGLAIGVDGIEAD